VNRKAVGNPSSAFGAFQKLLHDLAGMVTSAILDQENDAWYLIQKSSQKICLTFTVEFAFNPYVNQLTREVFNQGKHFIAFALATGLDFWLFPTRCPSISQGTLYRKAGFISKEKRSMK